MIPIYRPQPAAWWLARSSQLVRDCVKALDDNSNGKVLLSFILSSAKTTNGLRLWALQLQTITHRPNGNYLNKYFVELYDEYPEIAKKFVELVLRQGVAVSSTSGHFTSLAHLDPAEPLPAGPVSRGVLDIPMSHFVDLFEDVKYDVNYRPAAQGLLSEVLQLTYAKGLRVDIDIRLICDNRDPARNHALAYPYAGPGKLIYPLRMGRDTTPRLWQAKHNLALASMKKWNDEFGLFVDMSMTAIFASLPVGLVAPAPPVESPTAGPMRIPPRERAPSFSPTTTEDRAITRPLSDKPTPEQRAILSRSTASELPPAPKPSSLGARALGAGAGAATAGYPTAAGEVIGEVPPARIPSSSFGTAPYGQEIESELVLIVRRRFPRTEFKINTGRGRKGPDVQRIGGDDPGFDIADFKPDSASAYAKFRAQARRLWTGGPMVPEKGQFRAAIIQYQQNGTVFVGDIATVGTKAP